MWFVTNGDILMIFPYEISCLLALVPKTVVSKKSGVVVCGEEVM